jgi:hypothetical protein
MNLALGSKETEYNIFKRLKSVKREVLIENKKKLKMER